MLNKKKSLIHIIITAFLITIFCFSAYGDSDRFVQFEIAKRHFRKGTVFFNNMKYLAAVEHFRKAIGQFPDYNTAREYLARSYKMSGYIDSALREWESLYEVNPDNVSVLSKINSLRFQDTEIEKELQPSRFIFNNVYRSYSFRRFGFKHPLDIAVDNEKNLFITSFSGGKLIKINTNGKAVDITRTGLSSKLFGIDILGSKMLVSDFANDMVYLMTKKGDILKKIGKPGKGEGQFHGPEGVCFDPTGNLYVVDSANHRVQKFSKTGKFILQFGKHGEYEAELTNPTDVVFNNGKLYITDTGNKRLACFDDSGNFLNNISIDDMRKPKGISAQDSMLLVSDERKGLLFYDIKSKHQEWFTSWENNSKRFSMLSSSIFDRDGYLYCLDYNRESVYIFSHEKKSYSNLQVEIASVDTKQFPVVAFYVNIRSVDGNPVYGLDANNFKITEDSAAISGVYTRYLKKIRPSSSIVLCVERSRKSQGFHNELSWVSDFILKKMHKNDSIRLINFNNDIWEGNKFDWSRRRTIKALRKRDYDSGRKIGSALYGAVSDLLTKVNRRGVVLIAEGTVSESSFTSYSPRNIINYAKSNYIPIYIITFKEPDPALRRIAEESGGAIYRASDVDNLRTIYKDIKESEEYRYVLVYSTYKLPSFKGWWSQVKIDVNHKGQKGHEWGGYFVP